MSLGLFGCSILYLRRELVFSCPFKRPVALPVMSKSHCWENACFPSSGSEISLSV